MTPEDRAVIEQAVASFDVSRWARLDDHERDLCSRALRPASDGSERAESERAA